jgi:hypothetical protein
MKKNLKTLISLFIITPLLLGCPATTQVLKEKNEVRDELIIEIQNQIKDLGANPISESEAKFKKKLDKDKYISALKDQLKELKEKKTNKEADDKAKAAKNIKQENRKKAIQKYKSEIIMLGETPMLEFEVGTEDKYLAALKKQFEEAKKIKKEEEQKIKEAIPEWYVDMPIGTDLIMYARGTAISNDLQFSEDKAINSALLAVARKLQNNLTSKNKQMIKEAGLNEDLTLKTNIERASTLVIKNVVVSGYKVVKTKMAPRANGGYRTYVLVEYPVSLVYKNYLEEVNRGTNIVTKLTSLKNTQAYKDLLEAANTYSP